MDFKTFLENFDAIAEAPGGIPKLRSLILDLAVRGKLVSNNKLEEKLEINLNPSYFELILGEKVKFSRVPPLDLKAIPYKVPTNWSWYRLGKLGVTQTGTTPPTNQTELFGTDYPFIKPGAITEKGVDYQGQGLSFLGLKQGRFIPNNSILMVSIGGSIGKVGIVNRACSCNQQITYITPAQEILPELIYYFLKSPYFQSQVARLASTTTMPIINKSKWDSIPIPIAPLAEQKRIVEKVDELMALCDRYEAVKQTRDNLRQKLRGSAITSLMNAETDEELDAVWVFVRDNWYNLSQHPQDTSDLRQAILQLAVRGKLVPQDFKDEPTSVLLKKVEAEKRHLVKQKKLKERWNPVPVSPDAIPYKIPMNWRWIRILDGVERVTVGHVGSMQNEYVPEGVPFLRSQNVRENRFDPLGLKFISQEFHDKLAKSKLSPGDVVVVRSGNVGTTCVIPEALEDANCSDLVIVKRPMAIDSGFLSYYMNSAAKSHIKEGTVGIALTHFNTESVASLPIPLPPLAEQKRIVAKVDELMRLCHQLEASLRQSQQRAESLVASAISHLII